MDLRSLLRRPIHLVLDWDGTITKKDTLNFVGEIGYHHRKYNPYLDDRYGKVPPWSHFADAWMRDFSAHQAQYEPKPSARSTIQEERKWLASLASIENRSVRRVESSGLFRGVTVDRDMEVVAHSAVAEGRLQLRQGWDSLFVRALKDRQSAAEKETNRVSILSVNWSAAFIRYTLGRYVLRSGECPGPKEDGLVVEGIIKSIPIQANEIVGMASPGGSDGSLTKDGEKGIRTSADKLSHMPENCRHRLDSGADGCGYENRAKTEHTIIYVGDSATDFECLLSADIGICMRDEPMGSSQRELAETLERMGVEVMHLSKGFDLTGRGKRVIYWVRDLNEIADSLSAAGG